MNFSALPIIQTRPQPLIPNIRNNVIAPVILVDLRSTIGTKNYKIFDFLDKQSIVTLLKYKIIEINDEIFYYLYAKKYVDIIQGHIRDRKYMSDAVFFLLADNSIKVTLNRHNQYNFYLYALVYDHYNKEYIANTLPRVNTKQINEMIQCRDYDLLEKLYDKNVEISNINMYILELMKSAEQYKNNRIIDFLLSKDRYKTPIRNLLIKGDLDSIMKLYDAETDIRTLNNKIVLALVTDVKLAKYLLSKGVLPDSLSIYHAAYNGNLELLELYLNYNYMEYHKDSIISMYHIEDLEYDKIAFYAAFGGHIEIIEYLSRSSGRKVDGLLNYAVYSNDTYTVKRLYELGYKYDPYALMDTIAIKGSCELIDYFISQGMPITQHIIGNASTANHFRLIKSIFDVKVPIISVRHNNEVKYFNENLTQLDDITINKSLHNGTLKLIESGVKTDAIVGIIDLYYQTCPIDEGSIETAARHGHLELVEYFVSKKAPIDSDAFSITIERGYQDIFKVLHDYRPDLIIYEHIELAHKWNRYEIMELLGPIKNVSKTYDCFMYGNLDIVMSYNPKQINVYNIYSAAFNGHLHLIKYLHQNYSYLFDPSIIAIAARRGRLDIVKYLYENECPYDDTLFEYSIIRGRINVVKYLFPTYRPLKGFGHYIELAYAHNYTEIGDLIKEKENCPRLIVQCE